MIRRARLLCVVLVVLCGALGVISSTQTWLTVELQDAAHHVLDVPGASAVPVLAPLSLAVLALGAALSIVGPALRYVFGALASHYGVRSLDREHTERSARNYWRWPVWTNVTWLVAHSSR